METIGVVGSASVACALAQLEHFTVDGIAVGEGVGKNLVPVFFPGGLETYHPELFGASGVKQDCRKEGYCDCGKASPASGPSRAPSSISVANQTPTC